MNNTRSRCWHWILLGFIFVILSKQEAIAQPGLPPRTLTLMATQSLQFGTICINGGAGGTVTVGYDGSRTATGNLILLNVAPTAQPAIFEIKLCHGRNVCVTFDPQIILRCGNSTLTVDNILTDRGGNGARFVTNSDCNFITPLRLGGTLHIPGTAQPGLYTGDFAITIEQQ